jgi:glycosyltransferase involved in cell wall biosynthesis
VIRLLVDCVFFQLNNTGIARVWRSVLERLARSGTVELVLLDRGHAPRVDGAVVVPFPEYSFAYSADDSMLIQKLCDHYGADVFTSTYYTSPLGTPMVLMVHDMIPELFDFDLTQRGWMDKDASIAFAQRFLCVSHSTRRDLLSFYPEIPEDRVAVAHLGVDERVFRPRGPDEVAALCGRHGLDRPYFLFVGSRTQHKGYKNSRLFFDALAEMRSEALDVLCVGGEPEIEPDILRRLGTGVRCRRVELSDDELAAAYGGATALVYPSLYEGFGLPVIEAMASGCAVITTRHGSLAESAGDAAHFVSGFAVDEMCDAIRAVQAPQIRQQLVERGLEHARRFRWETMAQALEAQMRAVVEEASAGAFDAFFAEWRRLRTVQAGVDILEP